MKGEFDVIPTVAGLMALAARTAPKAKGVDTIVTAVVSGSDGLARLAAEMEAYGNTRQVSFFIRDARNVSCAAACVLIGCRGDEPASIDCGGCGYPRCAAMLAARDASPAADTPYKGPNCIMRASDLGIAVGSAVKTASIHNADNRVMYSAGVAALRLGLLQGCTMAYGIPLSATGKNIFFDR